MSPGRSNKPLFEVLSQHPPRGINPPSGGGAPAVRAEAAKGETASPADSAESVKTELKPRVVPVPGQRPATGRPGTERPESQRPGLQRPTGAGQPQTAQRQVAERQRGEPGTEELDEIADAPPRPVVTIPLSTVYSAVALAGALILIAWIAGHSMGASSKQAELTRGVQPRDLLTEPTDGVGNAFDGPGTDPGAMPGQTQDPTRNPAQSPQAAINPATTPATPAVSPAIQASANGTILSAAGMLEVDPREAGLNYLELGTFSREMARSAIDFLGASGVPVIGLPQPGGQYRLISVGLGVPGNQFTAMASQRTAHKRTIAEIGTRWVREKQGGSDFGTAQTQWTKYQP